VIGYYEQRRRHFSTRYRYNVPFELGQDILWTRKVNSVCLERLGWLFFAAFSSKKKMLELQYFTDENFCALNGTRKWTAGVQEIQ